MSAKLWMKMAFGGLAVCVGGPALVYYVTPSSDELFKRFNPELQKRSLENREQKQQDFDSFVNKLKEYSKSDKPIWTAAAEDEARTRAKNAAKAEELRQEQLAVKNQIKQQALK